MKLLVLGIALYVFAWAIVIEWYVRNRYYYRGPRNGHTDDSADTW